MADTCCAEGSNRMIIWCAGASNVGQMTNRIAKETIKSAMQAERSAIASLPVKD
jgi:uncharacterized metal-binding protein